MGNFSSSIICFRRTKEDCEEENTDNRSDIVLVKRNSETSLSDFGSCSKLESLGRDNITVAEVACGSGLRFETVTLEHSADLKIANNTQSGTRNVDFYPQNFVEAVSSTSGEHIVDNSCLQFASVEQDDITYSGNANNLQPATTSKDTNPQSFNGSCPKVELKAEDETVTLTIANENLTESDSYVTNLQPIVGAVGSSSGEYGQQIFNRDIIIRNFGLFEDDLDPLYIMDDLFENGCIEADQMDTYKMINERRKRARRFLLDFIFNTTDHSHILCAVLEDNKYSFILKKLIYEKRHPHESGRSACCHQLCPFMIIKAIITNAQKEQVPVDTGKFIIPLLETFLLCPVDFENIASKETIKERNEEFIGFLGKTNKDNAYDVMMIFLDALTKAGYDVVKMFIKHCYEHDIDEFPSCCKEKWKEHLETFQTQEIQSATNISTDRIQEQIKLDDVLYDPTENQGVLLKIIPQNISEQETNIIVSKINRNKENINAYLSPHHILWAQPGCIQITLAVPENTDINSTMKSIKHLLEWGDVFYQVKGQHIIIKLYTIHIPKDAEKEKEINSKYKIVQNFPFLIEEIDVLHFVKLFTERKILSEEEFETKIKIGSTSRKLRTLYFLNYILKADEHCLAAFYEVLRCPNYKYVFKKVFENNFLLPRSYEYIEPSEQSLIIKKCNTNSKDSNFSIDEICHPPMCSPKSVQQQTNTASNDLDLSPNSMHDRREKIQETFQNKESEAESLDFRSYEYLEQSEPLEQTLQIKHSNSNSKDSNFSIDENCHPPNGSEIRVQQQKDTEPNDSDISTNCMHFRLEKIQGALQNKELKILKPLLPRSHEYIEPSEQSPTTKKLNSKSKDSNFSIDENCHPPMCSQISVKQQKNTASHDLDISPNSMHDRREKIQDTIQNKELGRVESLDFRSYEYLEQSELSEQTLQIKHGNFNSKDSNFSIDVNCHPPIQGQIRVQQQKDTESNDSDISPNSMHGRHEEIREALQNKELKKLRTADLKKELISKNKVEEYIRNFFNSSFFAQASHWPPSIKIFPDRKRDKEIKKPPKNEGRCIIS